MTFARGARVGSAAGDAEAFAVDTSALVESGLLFQNQKSHDHDPDLLGRAVIDGQPFKVRADWRTARDGRRFLRLRFFPLREPPPREVAGR